MNDSKQPWPLAGRIAFRFFFVYWILHCLPWTGRVSLFNVVPGWQHYTPVWRSVVPWVGVHVLHVDPSLAAYRATGSSDTTFAYLQYFCFVVLAGAAALVWSLLDRKREDYRTLHFGLRLLLRYTLALTLLGYGVEKVFPFQFQFPSLGRMIEPFGQFSPMGLLWSFMGSSPAYTRFAGMTEVIGGLLLLSPRTVTLGAMLCSAVLLNVVALNFCYDAPVKLYSANLLAMAMFLLAPDIGRLAQFFLMNKPAERSGWRRIAVLTLKVAILGVVFVPRLLGVYHAYQENVVHPVRPPLYGLYEVESFVTNGKLEPWKDLIAEDLGSIEVGTAGSAMKRFRVRYDPGDTLVSTDKSGLALTSSRPDSNHVRLTGTIENDTVEITMRRRDLSEFLLASRGFHWINESPLNR